MKSWMRKEEQKSLEEENSFHLFAGVQQHILQTLQAGLFQVVCSRERRGGRGGVVRGDGGFTAEISDVSLLLHRAANVRELN